MYPIYRIPVIIIKKKTENIYAFPRKSEGGGVNGLHKFCIKHTFTPSLWKNQKSPTLRGGTKHPSLNHLDLYFS